MKIKKINKLIYDSLKDSIYDNDYIRLNKFIENRDFDNSQLLIQSIIEKENNKIKKERIKNYYLIIELKNMIDDYIDQLNYFEEDVDHVDRKYE